MSAKTFIDSISQYLLWDMDKSLLDADKHSSQIIQHVLELGTLDDWRLTRDYYGMDRIVSDCKKLRSLDPKALAFVCAMSDTNKEDYRCYHFRQSNPTLWYFYDWIDLPVIEDDIVMASPKDIAAMKINAVIGRCSKKDFVDIFQLLKIYSFADIMGFYHQKYPEYSDYMALRSVVYFEDAEPQEMPELFISENWSQMKKTIINAVKTFQL